MKIKLDENLPNRLVPVLSDFGHDVDTVRSEQVAGRDDADVWSAAQSAERFLITQDLDFSDVRRYTPGTHAGLLLVRLAKPGRDALLQRVARELDVVLDAILRALSHRQLTAPPVAPLSFARRRGT